MSNSVQELFNVSDQLAKNLDINHKLAVPKISKIVINAGIGAIKEDNKAIEKIKTNLMDKLLLIITKFLKNNFTQFPLKPDLSDFYGSIQFLNQIFNYFDGVFNY